MCIIAYPFVSKHNKQASGICFVAYSVWAKGKLGLWRLKFKSLSATSQMLYSLRFICKIEIYHHLTYNKRRILKDVNSTGSVTMRRTHYELI